MAVTPEASPVALAVVLAPVLVVGHIVLVRWMRDTTLGFVHLFLAFGLYGGTWFAVAAAWWGVSLTISQMIAGGATAGFACLAYMQVFSLVCRGFSLRILVDIHRCGALDVPGIMREYSDGHGIDWLVEKRIVVLERMRLIERRQDGLALVKPQGVWVGRMGGCVKDVLKPGQGG